MFIKNEYPISYVSTNNKYYDNLWRSHAEGLGPPSFNSRSPLKVNKHLQV